MRLARWCSWVSARCSRAGEPGDREGIPVPQTGFPYITFCFSIHVGTKSRRLNEACPFVLGGGRFFAGCE